MTVVVLLHDLGDPQGGAAWRAAAPEGWLAPDLPGHGDAPAPRHGAYDPMGPVTLARWALADAPAAGVAVGVAQNAHGALLLAAGGACGAAVVVDGLWGPWLEPDEAIDGMYAGLRRLVADDGAVRPPLTAGLDPRTAHGYGVSASPRFAQRFWGAITCPVLAIETPASTTPPAERVERVGWFGGDTALVELDDGAPATVVATVQAWRRP